MANRAARERPTTKPPWAAHIFESPGFAGGPSTNAHQKVGPPGLPPESGGVEVPPSGLLLWF